MLKLLLVIYLSRTSGIHCTSCLPLTSWDTQSLLHWRNFVLFCYVWCLSVILWVGNVIACMSDNAYDSVWLCDSVWLWQRPYRPARRTSAMTRSSRPSTRSAWTCCWRPATSGPGSEDSVRSTNWSAAWSGASRCAAWTSTWISSTRMSWPSDRKCELWSKRVDRRYCTVYCRIVLTALKCVTTLNVRLTWLG